MNSVFIEEFLELIPKTSVVIIGYYTRTEYREDGQGGTDIVHVTKEVFTDKFPLPDPVLSSSIDQKEISETIYQYNQAKVHHKQLRIKKESFIQI